MVVVVSSYYYGCRFETAKLQQIFDICKYFRKNVEEMGQLFGDLKKKC
jgi:hypothetical protein